MTSERMTNERRGEVHVEVESLAERPRRRFIAGAAVALAVLSGCAGGERPRLIEEEVLRTSAVELAERLSPAPAGTATLVVPADLSFSPTEEDALLDWAAATSAPYVGDCSGVTPPISEPQALCSFGAEGRNVVYLGPDAATPWHVMTFVESVDGLRVADSAVAGATG